MVIVREFINNLSNIKMFYTFTTNYCTIYNPYLDSKLKYQDLINSFNFKTDCPNGKSTVEKDTLSYRWCLSPINHEWNFLPNHYYDEAKGPPPRKNFTEDKKCSRCSLSFFTSLNHAKNLFNGYPIRTRELLGYTHVAEGVIDEKDGVVSEVENSHFSLFEFEGVELISKFKIVDVL